MSGSPSTPPPSKRKRQDSPHSTPLRPSLHIATSNHYAIDDRFIRAAEETKGSYEKLSIATFLSPYNQQIHADPFEGSIRRA
ncbi:hypothetical protein D9757_010323 [Collybiopsis confluens]|uniref:Uncharacterized protein n=1 Tax=Collybiopsis confluens TaxID=2823264 RepID=A0A8H5LSI9_9AGAR|nr:hypothetical protein D9757_010323 [Collybiopsis confluens]